MCMYVEGVWFGDVACIGILLQSKWPHSTVSVQMSAISIGALPTIRPAALPGLHEEGQ